jgi:biopolymer transport protein ExbD
MNMFIILIPFLISMTAFTHLAAQDFSLPGNEGPDHATERVDLPLTVALGIQGLMVVQGDVVVAEFARLGDGQDLAGLTALLRTKAPARLIVAVDGPVTTNEIVACLDACRGAGCTDVGLAAGTGVVLSGKVEP